MKRARAWGGLPVLPLTVLSVAALTFGVAIAGAMVTVDQKGVAFSVSDLTVNKGDIVSFNNDDNTSHNIMITGDGVSLNSGLQQPGVAFKAPMIKPGVYAVTCGIHPKMKMTITVK